MSVSYHRTVCFITSVLLLTACGGDSTSPDPQPTVAGTYALTAVNDSPVPFAWFVGPNDRMDLLSGYLSLNSNLTYRQRETFRATRYSDGLQITDESIEVGTYSITNGQITFTMIPQDGSASPPPYTGSIGDGAVAYTWEGITFRFER